MRPLSLRFKLRNGLGAAARTVPAFDASSDDPVFSTTGDTEAGHEPRGEASLVCCLAAWDVEP